MPVFEESLGRELGAVIREQLDARDKVLLDEIAKLRTRIAEVEGGGLKYCGIYQRAASYRRGDVTTFDGSMWCAVEDVAPSNQPGKSQGWQLCCRAGRDAKATA